MAEAGISAGRQGRGALSGPARATLILIVVTFVLRALGAAVIGWGTGEAYYLASARQFHLSYFDQPPLSLWITWATLQLTGSEDVLVLRLPFIALFSLSTWLVYLLAARLHSPLAGFYAALILNASVLFSLSIGSWMQPDAPMVVFWLATVWLLCEIFFGRGAARPWRYWLAAGLCLGLTFLSKYHALFLVGGVGLFMLANRDARRWFGHPALYVAALVALLVFLPVLVWNAQNHWASFSFQGGRAVDGQGLRWDGLLRMIWGQLLYMVPWLALPALVVGVKALLAGPAERFPAGAPPGMAALLAFIGFPPIVFFTLVALWSDTEFHFHWQAPGYLMLFVILGAWAAARAGRGVRAWLWGSALVTFLILSALVSHAATGWARQLFPGEWEDPTALQLPWTEVGEALATRGAFEADAPFIAGLTWIDCGYVDTQVRGRAPLACIGPDPRNIAFNLDLAVLHGRDALVVAQTGDAEAPIARLAPFFEEIVLLETLSVARNGRAELENIRLYAATGFAFSGPVTDFEPRRAVLTQLPRSAITEIAGTVANTGPSQSVTLVFDGQEIGALALAEDSTTAFAFSLPADWGVGTRTGVLEIIEAEEAEAVSFTALSVVRDGFADPEAF